MIAPTCPEVKDHGGRPGSPVAGRVPGRRPESGFIVHLNGTWQGGIGGTAPIWAGYTARVNDSTVCGGKRVGFVNPALYSIAASRYATDFHDITTGNDIDKNGSYNTRTGYDMVTGLGTMNGAPLAISLCGGKAPVLTASTPPSTGTVGKSYRYAFKATGKPAPTFALHSGVLPTGLTLNRVTGVLSGTPRTAHTFTFTVTAANSVGTATSRRETITIVKPEPAISITIRGAAFSHGAYTVHRGHAYTVTVLSATRPQYYDAAPYPAKPAPRGPMFTRNGTTHAQPRWTRVIHLTASMHRYLYWNIGVKIGHTLHILTLRVIA